MWRQYPTLIIDNEDPGHALDRLILAVDNPDLFLVSRSNDDLMLTCGKTQNVLVVRSVFTSPSAAHRHLQIELEDTALAVSVDRLVNVFTTANTPKNAFFTLSSAFSLSTTGS
jgi:insecticidal toxin